MGSRASTSAALVLVTVAALIVGLGGTSSTAATVDCPAAGPTEGPVPGSWKEAGSLIHPRSGHTATALRDGRVLIGGGSRFSSTAGGAPSTLAVPAAPAEVYDPETGGWTPTAPMLEGRRRHAAARLPDGRVLVTGGLSTLEGAQNRHVTETAEIYDPATNAWTPARPMTLPRAHHTATALPDDRILVTGGQAGVIRDDAPVVLDTFDTRSAEVYDPATGRWARTSFMRVTHQGTTTATMLPHGPFGTVLREGGDVLRFAERFDPEIGEWAHTGALRVPRHSHDTVRLPSGEALALGSFGAHGLTAERYDPEANAWCRTGDMHDRRLRPRAATLTGGRVLVAGGYDGGPLDTAERYDPAAGAWTRAGTMAVPRDRHTLTALTDGRALVVGGTGEAAATAEVFDPAGGSGGDGNGGYP